MRDFIAGVLILGALAAGGYVCWRAYARSRGTPLGEDHPRLRAVAIAAVLMLLLGGAVAPAEREPDRKDRPAAVSDTEKVATAEATADATATPTPTPDPAELVAQARQEVGQDRYGEALSIVATLGTADRSRVRRSINRRLALRARSALRLNSRSAARRLLLRAGRYPATSQYRAAATALTAADDRAAERAEARRLAREQREATERLLAEQRRAAREQARVEQAALEQDAPGGGCESGYDPCVPAFPPDVNCPDVAGPVTVTGSDPHGLDRDGDGVACET